MATIQVGSRNCLPHTGPSASARLATGISPYKPWGPLPELQRRQVICCPWHLYLLSVDQFIGERQIQRALPSTGSLRTLPTLTWDGAGGKLSPGSPRRSASQSLGQHHYLLPSVCSSLTWGWSRRSEGIAGILACLPPYFPPPSLSPSFLPSSLPVSLLLFLLPFFLSFSLPPSLPASLFTLSPSYQLGLRNTKNSSPAGPGEPVPRPSIEMSRWSWGTPLCSATLEEPELCVASPALCVVSVVPSLMSAIEQDTCWKECHGNGCMGVAGRRLPLRKKACFFFLP